MAALGTTARLVQLSISAKIGMTSPTKTDAHVGGGETEPGPASRNSCMGSLRVGRAIRHCRHKV